MKVISKNGNIMPVDDSLVDYETSHIPCMSVVTMIDDRVCLEPVWIVIVQRDKYWCSSERAELEFVAEKVFSSEPTEQELIYLMAENGLNCNEGYVTVEKSNKLNCNG